MKTSEQLFLLIQAMQKKEKRHFKLYTSKYNRAKEKDIVVLFDIINALEVYDEDEVIQKSVKRGIKNLSYVKNQLKKELLKALTDFNFNYADRPNYGDVLIKCDIGLDYKIPELVFEWVNKGKSSSDKTTNAFVKYHLSLKELTALLWNLKDNKTKIDNVFVEMRDYVRYMEAEIEYNELSISFLHWHVGLSPPLTPKDTEKMEPYLNSKWFQDESLALSFMNKRSLYFCKHLYYEAIKEYELSLKYMEKIVGLYSTDIDMADIDIADIDIESFIVDYSNLLFTYFDLNLLDNVADLLEEFKQFGEEQISVNDANFINYKFHYILVYFYYYHLTENRAGIIELIPLAEKYFLADKYQQIKHNLVYVYFFIINTFFVMNDYDNTVLWLRRFHKIKFQSNFPKMQLVIRFLEIALEIEFKHYRLAKSLLNRIKYFKNKTNANDSFVTAYSNGFRYLMDENITRNSDKSRSLIEEIERVTKDMPNGDIHYNKDLKSWFVNKLQQKQ